MNEIDEQELPAGTPNLGGLDTDDPANRYHLTSDEAALRDMGKRTSTMGKVVTVLILAGAGAMAYMYVQSERQHDANRAELEEINRLEDASQVPGRLAALLPKVSDPDMRARILLNLGHLRAKDAVPAMIGALDTKGVVRRDAAMALSMIGSPTADGAKGKLLAVLPSSNEIDRSSVVWALAVLGETQAADAILKEFVGGMLQEKPGFDPAIVARALGSQRLASAELLGHKDAGVRALTAHALAEAASPEVVDPLVKLLESELARSAQEQSTEVIRAAAEGLGRSGDPRAGRPLFALLEANPGMRASVLDALGKSTAAPGLEGLLKEAKDEKSRADLVTLLAQSRDPRAAGVLTSLLASEDVELRFKAAMGLADLGDGAAIDALLAFAAGDDNPKADAALMALRTVTRPGLGGALMAIVKDRPHRKASVLRALGASKDPAAGKLLEAELAGDDIGAAAMALADLGSDSGWKKMMTKLPRPKALDMREPNVKNETVMLDRKAAIQGLGRYGREDAAAGLATVIEDPLDDPRLRSLAAAAFGSVATDGDFAAAMERVRGTNLADDARAFYMEALWQRPRPALVGDMMALLEKSTSSSVRLAAAIAVGYAGDTSVEGKLVELLAQPNTARDAAVALALGSSAEATAKLIDALKASRDLEDQLRTLLTEDSDTFRVVTEGMFTSGQFWRRAATARALAAGDGKRTYPYAWQKVIEAARSGWDGTEGVSKRALRDKLWAALMGEAAEPRDLAARILTEMPERGLLLRARDEGGAGGEAARKLLRGGATE